jgi:WD40 repeat protein
VVLRGHEGKVYAVAISPDNRWLVTVSFDHTARLWDLRAEDPAANPLVLRGHDGWVYAVAISPDNRLPRRFVIL